MLSILVKDMLLPKSCYECPLNTGEYSPAEYEKRYCAITDRSMCLSDYKKRPSDCPLVEVPKPHGKLVEFIDVTTYEDDDSGTETVNLGEAFAAYFKMREAKPVIEAEGE